LKTGELKQMLGRIYRVRTFTKWIWLTRKYATREKALDVFTNAVEGGKFLRVELKIKHDMVLLWRVDFGITGQWSAEYARIHAA
jgi:hypothetical protein